MSSIKPTAIPRMDPDVDPRADALNLIQWIETNGVALAPIADWRTVCHNLRSALAELGGPDDPGVAGRSWSLDRIETLEECLRGVARWVQAGGDPRYREGALRRIREVLGG